MSVNLQSYFKRFGWSNGERLPVPSMSAQECIVAAKPQIFTQWLVRTKREIPATQGQSKPALVNSLSHFLDHLVEMLKGTNSAESDFDYKILASGHGEQRAQVGRYTLKQINREFALLQEVIFDVLQQNGGPVSVIEARIISIFFQTAVSESGSAFLEAVDAARIQSETQFKLLVQEAKEYAIFMIDPQGTILSWNEGAARMKQYTSAEAIGQNFRMLYREEDRKDHRAELNIKLALELGRHVEQWWRIKKDGTLFWADAVMTPVYSPSGALLGLSKIVRDLSDKKATEDELLAAKESAENASRLKNIFVANVSHEIRTPLGAILGFCDFLKDPNCTPEDRLRAAEVIDRSGLTLLRLIEDILDISKIEAGKLEIHLSETPVQKIVQEVIQHFKARAEDKGLGLELFITPNVPDGIICDPERLRQILLNVVGNAVKFTDKGSIKLEVKRVEREDRSSELEFLVTDTGAGLTPIERSNLFAPFSQADSSATRKNGGSGLGLALSRRLARRLGGDLVLMEEPSASGCAFKITIADQARPEMTKGELLASTPLAPARAPAVEKLAISPDFSQAKVLIVDDSPDNQLLIQTLLGKWGVKTDCVDNGAEAVKRAPSEPYDLILMDIQMPVLDGNQATTQLRQTGYTRPIVAITAHAMLEEKEKAFASGFDDYLLKPIQKSKLLDVLMKFAVVKTS